MKIKNAFLKYCKPYRRFICKYFGIPSVYRISIPFGYYGDFGCHYLAYDKDGEVKKGFSSLFEAIKNRGDLGLTVIYNRY